MGCQSVFGQQKCVPVSAFHLVENTMHILKGSLASLIPLPISAALSNISCSCFRRFIRDMPVHGTGLMTLVFSVVVFFLYFYPSYE